MGNNVAVAHSTGGESQAMAWREAQARLELYVGALGLEPAPAAELVARALDTARAAAPAQPLAAAVEALDRLLAQLPPQPHSMPAMGRGAMVPERLDRSPLNFVFSELVAPFFAGLQRLILAPRGQRLLLALAISSGALLLRVA